MPDPTAGRGSRRKRVFVLTWRSSPSDGRVVISSAWGRWVARFIDLWSVPQAKAVEYLHENVIDGILAHLDHEGPILEFCRSAGVPVVDLSEARPELDVPRVLLDEVAIGRMAGEHFVERGFRHFAFCSAYDHYALAGRLEGFREAVEPISETFHVIEARPGGEVSIMRPDSFASELARLPKPLAVMAFDDVTADLVVAACEMAELLVPEQVAVVGCNNSPRCEMCRVRSSSVEPGFDLQSYEAARLLGRLMAGERPPAEPIRVQPVALRVRESSDIFAIENVTAARAVSFIIQEWRRPELCLDSVANQVGLSRTHIEVQFRRYLNSGVAEYIRNMRIRQVKTRLLQSAAPIQEVAAYAGFRSASHFSKLFRKATGLSPKQWREEHAEENPPDSEA